MLLQRRTPSESPSPRLAARSSEPEDDVPLRDFGYPSPFSPALQKAQKAVESPSISVQRVGLAPSFLEKPLFSRQ